MLVPDKQLHKALMHVFGKRHKHIVRVDYGSACYYVITEPNPKKKGHYIVIEYPYKKLNGIDKELKKALKTLKWIADGNEFPT